MKLQGKFLLVVGIPAAGLLTVFVVGLVSFAQIADTVEELNQIQEDRASLVNADRDAYQAYVAELEAMMRVESAELNQAVSDWEENVDQVFTRISEPAARFDDEMNREFSRFRDQFDQWTEHGRGLVETRREIADESRNKTRRPKRQTRRSQGCVM